MSEPKYEIQMQERDGRQGFVVTISVGRDTWTSQWIEGGTDEAAEQVEALAEVLQS